jgi:hypothetical protein
MKLRRGRGSFDPHQLLQARLFAAPAHGRSWHTASEAKALNLPQLSGELRKMHRASLRPVFVANDPEPT